MPRKTALIGYGAIARTVLETLRSPNDIRITQVLVRPERVAELSAQAPAGVALISDPRQIDEDTEFVLECASHDAVRTYGPLVLARGHDLGLLSVGALAEESTCEALNGAALRGGARLSILPGAIGGIDALAAAGPALEEVTYTSRKPPRSWAGSPAEASHDLDEITEPTVIFSGSAREAALSFPKNANVVATVALAAIGFDRTKVTLMADPDAKGNTHRIVASGHGYALDFSTRGAALPDNPRTSALTAQSALRALRQRAPGLSV